MASPFQKTGLSISRRFSCRNERVKKYRKGEALKFCFIFFYAFVMTQKNFFLPSFAKINLHLRVLGKRPDGFHELCTVFQTVSLKDEIWFEESNELSLTCSVEKVPCDESNLIIKAAKLLKEVFNCRKGAKIHLEKKIPSPGGLGGGSSNAAVALLGLTMLWEIETPFENLVEIAGKLGSDVPFFLYGGTALGFGRGEKIELIEEVKEKFLLLVTPPIAISTAAAFARLNKPNLTNFSAKSILKLCRNEVQNINVRHQKLTNDFEQSVFALYPEVRRVKEKLLELGAAQALLSGSGASVFALFDKKETRQATIKALEKEKNWRMFAVATVSRSEYWKALCPPEKVVSD